MKWTHQEGDGEEVAGDWTFPASRKKTSSQFRLRILFECVMWSPIFVIYIN